ncbi:MAG: hypothetical protein ACI8O8_002257 [Oleiphilaceae bacterium]|jgi:hypothetical protein
MCIDDGSKYGRLKDHLAVLSSICEDRLQTIKSKLSSQNQRKDILTRIIQMTEEQVTPFPTKNE